MIEYIDLKTAYQKAIDYRNQDLTLLFQRLNYFLIGSAFLITAYATLITRLTPDYTVVTVLTYVIEGVGIYLSLFFAIINYLNNVVIEKIDDYIRCLENTTSSNFVKPFTYLKNDIVASVQKYSFNNNPLNLLGKVILEVIINLINPFNSSNHRFAPNTFIIPLGFFLFWILVTVLIKPNYWLFLNLAPLFSWVLGWCVFFTTNKIVNKIKICCKKHKI
jgi:hypothetical protein